MVHLLALRLGGLVKCGVRLVGSELLFVVVRLVGLAFLVVVVAPQSIVVVDLVVWLSYLL